MTTLIVLLVLLINLMVSFVLIGMIYLMVILPLSKQMKEIKQKSQYIPKPMEYYTGKIDLPASFPNNLPDLDDIPEESFYGDEEPDHKTTPEEVEDAIAERTFNTYNGSQTTSKQQLGSLKM